MTAGKDRQPETTRQVRLEELLEQWEEACEAGQEPEPEDLCREFPELLDDLRRQIAALKAVDEKLQSGGSARPNAESSEVAVSADGTLSAEMHYCDLQFHARGGLGTLYRASDHRLNREVAVKFIRSRFADDAESYERFLLEAEITSRLEHPGVVPLYAIGHTADGRPFYVMRFVRGTTLDDAIRTFHEDSSRDRFTGLEFRKLLDRFIAVCRTIAYAHKRGIVHRDIKPSNVLLGQYGETLVVDWGLATPVQRDDRARASGEQTLRPRKKLATNSSSRGAGTPAYMSPEQFAQTEMVTPLSDVYSLGASLYKVLTGRTAFEGHNAAEIGEHVHAGYFLPPQERDAAVPAALDAICLQAMATNPEDRYPDAEQLAEDLQRWLADEPVTAFPERWSGRLGRLLRRHRQAVLSTLIGLILLVLLAAGTAVRLGTLAQQEHAARLAADEARIQGLRVSARFAARTVATEMDLRWRILEGEANDPELRQGLTEATMQRETWKPLQGWLDARYVEHNDAARATSWFLTNAEGIQVARSPAAETIGRSYAFRDYFHGQGRDLPRSDADDLQPIRHSYRSVVFRSEATDNLMVAFAVPVWNGPPEAADRRVLGILAMTVELGHFGVLSSELGGREALLVETTPVQIDGEEVAGLILHHPALRGNGGRRPGDHRAARMPQSLLERLQALSDTPAADQGTVSPVLLPDYRDPLTGENRRAAACPVHVRGRPKKLRKTGWMVLVQEQSSQ